MLASYLRGLNDPEVRRLTRTRSVYERNAVKTWLATRNDHDDRADWAVIRSSDNAYLGEVVLNQLDAENASVSYRIWLSGIEATGRGYRTESTRLVVAYAFDDVGLRRVRLSVYDFNPRARRTYENCGSRQEGRLGQASHRDGTWHDEDRDVRVQHRQSLAEP